MKKSLAAVVLLLTACSGWIGWSSWHGQRRAAAARDKLKVGMTKEDVLRVLPSDRRTADCTPPLADGSCRTVTFLFDQGPFTYVFSVWFGRDGRVESVGPVEGIYG
jgi:hypothetical protein